MDVPETPRRRWLTHERTVLLMVALVAALGLGWLGSQAYWIAQRRAFLAEMEARDVAVMGSYVCVHDNPLCAPWPWAVAPWPLHWFGEAGNEDVYVPFPRSSPQVACAKRLFPESRVFCLLGPPIADAP
jgi:hypothetical protein